MAQHEKESRAAFTNLWGLSSIYSVRMYELLKQYEKIGKRWFKLEDLRLILGMNQGEYPLYANFKQKVILKAQRDLEALNGTWEKRLHY